MNNELKYFTDGKLVSNSGNVNIYKMNGDLFVEDGRMNLISSDSAKSEYIWQLGNKPKGKCLVLGLGTAMVPKYIMTIPKVISVTTVEENSDVIKAISTIVREFDKLDVKCDEYLHYLYSSTNQYDFIFVNCYYKVDNSTIPYIADIITACKTVLAPDGVLLGWLDINTPEKYIDTFYKLFDIS